MSVQFHKGVPTTFHLQKWSPKGGFLKLDDLMVEGGEDKELLNLLTKHSYHRNITVLYLCQDMFTPGKYAKSISRNAHYVIACKNPRDQLGVRNLVLQAFPTYWQDVMDVYQKVIKQPFGYMVPDLHPASDDRIRLLSHLFTHEGFLCCALPKKERSEISIAESTSIGLAYLKQAVLGERSTREK